MARWQTYRWRVWRYQKNKPSQGSISRNFIDGEVGQSIRREREPLADANLTEKEIKVILKMPGVKKKEGIKLILSDDTLEIYTNDRQRKYRKNNRCSSGYGHRNNDLLTQMEYKRYL